MGRLSNGAWVQEDWKVDTRGAFVRARSTFRERLGGAAHPAEPGRYHLYVSYACPWAHRTLIARAMYGLEDVVSVTAVDPLMLEKGWTFSEAEGCGPDPLFGADTLADLYVRADPNASCRVTVPVLWDKATDRLVNNESREIVRDLGRAMRPHHTRDVDLCPEALEAEVEAAIDEMYAPINNGVYRAGFAGSQLAYNEAVTELFDALAAWDERLEGRRWLVGEAPTEADLFLFTTLFRFDPVYFTHFKCNLKHLWDFPNLFRHTQAVYGLAGVKETCRVDHIKAHYFGSHPQLNPRGIVPLGPARHLEAD